MELLSFSQLFGHGCVFDGEKLVIQKSSLLGLTANPNNRATAILVSILITALQNFSGVITDENNQVITDENNQSISFDNSEIYELLKIISWKPYRIPRNTQPYVINQIIVFSYANDL